MKDLVGKPIGNRKLASIANNFFLVNMEEEKLKDLNKKYSRLENCPNMVTPKRSSEVWKSNLTSTYRMNKITSENRKFACQSCLCSDSSL